jgi:putative DNA primase/helicase
VASCTIIMAANDSPKARDDDPGLWRRIQRVPFPNALPVEAQIKGLGETLRESEHAEAILAWAVEGCRLWQAQGVGTSSAVETSTEEYKTENDWLAGFIDMFELDTHATIKASNFRSLYKTYCEQEGQFTETTKELAKQMEERLPGVRYTKYAGERIWKGLKLKSGQVEPGEERWT